jgi:hypothetical protein
MKRKNYIVIGIGILIISSFLVLFFIPYKQSITGEVVSIITPDYIEFRWGGVNAIQQKIGIATDCISLPSEDSPMSELVTECDWQYQDLELGQNSFKDYDIESRLKFYQIESKTKIGEGSCKPECVSGSQGEGWYDPCTNEFFKLADCASEQRKAYCCLIDYDSQGWYSASCDQLDRGLTGMSSDYLIHYDGICQYSAQVCDQKSDIFVKFTQDLVLSTPGSLEETSINWVIATKDILVVPGDLMESATELLRTQVVDYVAYWNPNYQEYYGAAFGTSPVGMHVVTGNFVLNQYHPYFVGAKQEAKITWVGKLPDWQTFELKYVEEYMGQTTFSKNYIVIPFDTSLEKAADICDALDLPGTARIGAWDPIMQQYINDNTRSRCSIITGPGQGTPLNFDLNPGQVYEIEGLEQDITWTQK